MPEGPAFDRLHPRMRAYLASEGFTRPTAAQQAAIPVILTGRHTLLIAPTGMGKTESAVIPVFDGLIRFKERVEAAQESPEARRRRAAGLPPKPGPAKGISVIYVTPLRALNRDLMGRLHAWGTALGLDVRVRHGDTSQRERQRQSREPPDVLITTPETLQALFMGARLKDALAAVKCVVVDEVHELAEGERGAQLAFALERLEEVVEEKGGRPFQRVGLSATVGDPEEVAGFLGGGRPVETVKVQVARNLDLAVTSPRPTERDEATARKLMCRADAAAYLNRCLDLIKRHTSTLLFVNTRESAEVLSARIRILDPEFPVRVHHGSLSRDVRIAAEEDFKQGRVAALICTSSMELGIDIGSADLVIQYTSPRQVTRLVQRVGRAGHRHDLVSNGVVVGQDPDDVLEAAVIVKRTLAEEMESFRAPRNPLDVLANQLAALAVERRVVSADEAYEMARRTQTFHDLDRETFDATLGQLEEQWVVWREDGKFGSKKKGRMYLYQNLSMIPDERTYRVVNMVTRRAVATLDEGFVASFMEPGAAFICQGQPWRVVELDAERDEIRVEPLKDPLGAVPSWVGEEIPVPFEVAQGVGALRARIRELADAHGDDEVLAALAREYHLDEDAAWKALMYVDEQSPYAIPTDRVITLEWTPGTCVVNACFGSRVNETLGRLLSALLTAKLGQSVGLQLDAYRIILTLPGRANARVVKETLLGIEPDTVQALLEMLLVGSAYLKHRLMHVARKFAAIAKQVDHHRVNVGRLLDLYKGTPLYREAMREVFDEKLDVALTARILREIREGEREIVEQDLSPIGAAGLDQRVELVSPARADVTLLEALRDRIRDERIVLACMTCREWKATTRVARAVRTRRCPNCGGGMLAAVRPWNETALKAWKKRTGHSQEERAELKRLTASANLVFDHGERALLALTARGVGPDAAGRILSKQRDDDTRFLRDVLEAEITYARTRQFWD